MDVGNTRHTTHDTQALIAILCWYLLLSPTLLLAASHDDELLVLSLLHHHLHAAELGIGGRLLCRHGSLSKPKPKHKLCIAPHHTTPHGRVTKSVTGVTGVTGERRTIRDRYTYHRKKRERNMSHSNIGGAKIRYKWDLRQRQRGLKKVRCVSRFVRQAVSCFIRPMCLYVLYPPWERRPTS